MSDETTSKDDRSENPDEDDRLEILAQRFLDLWREQVTVTADGTRAASAIGRLYASLGADTTRMGEGFEAWGNLIGQMAMGQHPGMSAPGLMAHPMAAGIQGPNPLQSMMDQMTKATRDVPMPPFPGPMPFPPNMAGMADMAGAARKDTPTQKPSDPGVKSNDTAHPKSGRKKTAKGQGKNDQSATTKETSAQKGASEKGGAKAASDAHGGRDDELAQLARRIADLSETIAALEGRTPGKGDGPSDGD